jgi:N-acetylglucosamine-6-phosphate deacetylase
VTAGDISRGALALINATIYTGDEVLDGRALVIENGTVVALPTDLDESTFPGEVIDVSGLSLAPGLIDLQANGGGDLLFNDSPSPETLQAIVAAHLRCGTTDLLASYITAPAAGLRLAANAIQEARRLSVTGLLGVHFEGPLLSMANRGVHNASLLRTSVDDELFDQLSAPARSGPTMVTLAPETVPAGFIEALAEQGVAVSAGHTEATPDQIHRAVDEGLRAGTHVWNGMPPIRGRRPGPVPALLSDSRVWCAFIADGHHLSAETLAFSLDVKAPRRSILVSDAMPPVGGTRSTFTLDGRQITVRAGRCETAEGHLAGAAAPLIEGVRHCVVELGVPIAEALRMASLYPAECLGIEDRRGRIAAGYPARIVALDAQISPVAVVVGSLYRPLEAVTTRFAGEQGSAGRQDR